jgi:gliding motility-associated-like protein
MRRFLNRLFFLSVVMILNATSALATHNRAGEITYLHVEGLTYEVLITTYTKASALADRPSLYLLWGDENGTEVDSLERESINIFPGDIQINIYQGTHTYGGPGIFEIKVEDPNRNEGVLNMVGSVDTPFAIRSLLIIDPIAGHNNSVQLLNPATENACLNRDWVHNPAAYDPDGDLLVYSLVPCRGFNGDPIPTYVYPDDVSLADDMFFIDSQTGDVMWNSPQIVGEYNIAIRVEEFRDVDGVLIKVGEVIRDMQIDVQICNNLPPELSEQPDTCIVAGSFLTWYINASDPDGDNLTLSALGGPITEVENTATFTNLGGGIGEFAWAPTCAEVRLAPYQVVFKAKDQGNAVSLTDLETAYIRVVAPAIEDVFAEPVGNTVLLGWSGGLCNETLEPWQREQGYHDIYRRLDSQEWEPTVCETGLPEELGYELIASIQDLINTSYVDEDLLSYGATYCYRVVMRLGDGSESLASDEVCATIIKDVPVMTHADVLTTDENGEVYVGWSPPTDMDEEVFPLPYTYKVFRGGSSFEEVASGITDTSFVDLGVDTRFSSVGYKIEAWCETVEGPAMVGVSQPARTPFLSLTPNDNRITLEVVAVVPWVNMRYFIERKTLEELDFTPYDTTDVPMYVDSGLVNTQEYCYRVITDGRYDSEYIENPLLNSSQSTCSTPYDYTPPCPPALEIEDDCAQEIDLLSWSGAHECADDIMGYVLYWAPFEGDTLQPYAEFNFVEGWELDSTFIFNDDNSEGTIAGCFAVTALDSLLVGPSGEMRRNESEFSNIVCVDNCPFYFLPNVFTPNGDSLNDMFIPFQWKFIHSIDLVIYNRWGIEVFKTDDPNINWDGRHYVSGEDLPDGVYFYTLIANTIRLEGIVPERFSGEIQILGSKGSIVE